MAEFIIYEKKDHVVVLTMNRPDQMNATHTPMNRELGQAYVDFRDDNDAWVLIITGAGDRAFSAGMDLKERLERPAEGTPSVEDQTPSLKTSNIEIWKPIIAAINGVAAGGGLELAMACDVRIAAENARLGLMELKRGINPATGMARLPRQVPLNFALEMLFSGDLISAQEAYRLGLVNQVVPLAELMPAAHKMAQRFLQCAPLAIQAAKETVYRTVDIPLKDALGKHYGPDLGKTEDAKEGPRAFAEKRPPVWKGK